MDIGKMSMSMSQNSLKSAVSISLLKMTMNNNQQVANGMTQMLDATMVVDPNLGSKIDTKA
ncbi:YjfB family protein [uncultured Clostridium sp.]|uniref:YjfB family protein n=1 Tax=uncultured Clostridium sp. TaxID=59620 RepID=UPI00261C1A7B|nr:YjfB family protein [uncultured Clostridium sp.]